MFVEVLVPQAKARLVTIVDDASVIEAARLLRPAVEMVVVCTQSGVVAGLVTKTDIVGHVGRLQSDALATPVSNIMTQANNILSCQIGDDLLATWKRMNSLGRKNIPVVDDESRVIGILNARDVLRVLFSETAEGEQMMKDYIAGIGYR